MLLVQDLNDKSNCDAIFPQRKKQQRASLDHECHGVATTPKPFSGWHTHIGSCLSWQYDKFLPCVFCWSLEWGQMQRRSWKFLVKKDIECIRIAPCSIHRHEFHKRNASACMLLTFTSISSTLSPDLHVSNNSQYIGHWWNSQSETNSSEVTLLLFHSTCNHL